MYNIFKNTIFLLLFTFKLCTSIFEGDFSLQDLAVTCGVTDHEWLEKPTPGCTSMAVWAEHITKLHYGFGVTGSLPLLVRYPLDFSAISNVRLEDMDIFFSNIMGITFQFMVFDNAVETLNINGDAVTQLSQELGCFLENVRTYFSGVLLGIKLSNQADALSNKMDLKILNEHVDFFLLDSVVYRPCEYHKHQADMNVLATAEDIAGSLKSLKDRGINLNKVIYTIDLLIDSRKDSEEESMAYTYLCDNKLSKERKYCFNTIENLFDKARLRITEKAAGIFILRMDHDDVYGRCGCITQDDGYAEFRGVKTIAGASTEGLNSVSFYRCTNGEFPVILD